ncbi:hypothetical protein RvY_10936 [Ramazzottius varieornatus]|uniref:Chromo domain-containing protein n=1 Tax=Ramazzottius varieornatus TaxID=947166 RepID=A0A1D1VEG1_RAMVA|nr:hypothetical protein RvY_10936 [Ramazzottius varieornatus]
MTKRDAKMCELADSNLPRKGFFSKNHQSEVSAVFENPAEDEKRVRLDAAVEDILKNAKEFRNVRVKYRFSYAELDQALIEKGAADLVRSSLKRRQQFKPDASVLERAKAAVKDAVANRLSLTAAARIHKVGYKTLLRYGIEKGIALPQRSKTAPGLVGFRMENALRDVLDDKMSAKRASKHHKVGHRRLSRCLKAQGYIFDKTAETSGKWVKKSENSEQQLLTATTSDNEDEKWRENEERASAQDALAVEAEKPERDLEIEKIMDYRVQRQYLVKWQGEEKPTWVNGDVFVGLTNLQIK